MERGLSDGFNLADLPGCDDWLGSGPNAADLAEFSDDFIAASLAVLDSKDDLDDLDFQDLLPDRGFTRSPVMRGSYSMNDLTTLQLSSTSAWNHKLVSVKPKLEPVPEGGPSTGGPLNLMPLASSGAGAVICTGQPVGQPGMKVAGEDYLDMEACLAPAPGIHGSLPSTNTLSMHLHLTHVKSEAALAPADGSAAGPSASSVVPSHQGRFGHGPGYTAAGLHNAALQHGHQHMAQAQYLYRSSGEHAHILTEPGCSTRGTSNSHTCQPGGDSCSADAGEAGGSLAALAGSEPPAAGARRAPSGLPLRKSQSAVELGSWRSFNAGEEYWDHALGAEGIQAGKLTPAERLLRIQRYREKRQARNTHRNIKYQCRKSLAEARLRVKGRFVKSDEAGPSTPADGMDSGQPTLLTPGAGCSGGGAPASTSPCSTQQSAGQPSSSSHTSSGTVPSSSTGPPSHPARQPTLSQQISCAQGPPPPPAAFMQGAPAGLPPGVQRGMSGAGPPPQQQQQQQWASPTPVTGALSQQQPLERFPSAGAGYETHCHPALHWRLQQTEPGPGAGAGSCPDYHLRQLHYPYTHYQQQQQQQQQQHMAMLHQQQLQYGYTTYAYLQQPAPPPLRAPPPLPWQSAAHGVSIIGAGALAASRQELGCGSEAAGPLGRGITSGGIFSGASQSLPSSMASLGEMQPMSMMTYSHMQQLLPASQAHLVDTAPPCQTIFSGSNLNLASMAGRMGSQAEHQHQQRPSSLQLDVYQQPSPTAQACMLHTMSPRTSSGNSLLLDAPQAGCQSSAGPM
ncbi:hypothetical protein QJQ45_004283 [Haematococcus lacustris]|nr:hypothetical protein QJQ45_004283 [Haematococcus lacustris]